MSKRAAKLTLISTSIVSGLLLILYLPVLIWSPPWGEDGYYSASLKEGTLVFHLETNNSFCKLIRNGKSQNYREITLFSLNEPYPDLLSMRAQELNTNIIHQMKEVKFSPSRRKVIFYTFKSETCDLGKLDSSESVSITRVNPFTLWYIKWLEWTN